MTALLTLMLTILISLLLSTLLVRILAGPLQSMLRQLCPTEDAGGFWVAFTTVMLYVAPLLFSVFFQRFDYDFDLARTLRSTLAATLFGAFASLLVVGYKLANVKPVVKRV